MSVPRLAFSQGALPRSLEANPNLDTWLRINADGTVSIWTGKAELGQGIRTALAQIAAEELDVAFERIRIEAVDTARSPSEGRTTGSVSIERSGAAIRMASAEARQLLLQNAAARLNIPAARLSVDDGQVLADGRDAELSYRELLSDAAFDTRATASVAPKRPDQHRIVGTPQERIDLPAKFFGEPAYVHDLRMPDMLHARVVRPEMDSARLAAVETEAVGGMDGVVAVVRDGSFLAVVAEREEQAVAAADTLRANATWEQLRDLPEENRLPGLLRELQGFDPEVIFNHAAPGSAANSNGHRQFTADYSRPYISHASMAPSAAVAQWDGTRLTVWSHTQGAFELRGAIATALDLPESQVRLYSRRGRGLLRTERRGRCRPGRRNDRHGARRPAGPPAVVAPGRIPPRTLRLGNQHSDRGQPGRRQSYRSLGLSSLELHALHAPRGGHKCRQFDGRIRKVKSSTRLRTL